MLSVVKSPSHVTPEEILLADHFTDDSARALGYGRAIALRFGSHVTIAHVSEPFNPIQTPEGYALETLGYVPSDPEEQLRQRSEDLRASGVRADTTERTGDVVPELVAAAQSASADLLVFGTHAPHTMERLLLGSVSERMANTSGWPVMVVGPQARTAPAGPWRPARILCLLEQSECSIAAAVYGVRLSQALGARVTYFFSGSETSEIPLSSTGLGRALAEELPDVNVAREVERRYFAPEEAMRRVLRCAADDEVGAIVLCAEAGGRLHTHLHRTVLARLLAEAPCPVIVTGRGRANA